MLQKNSKRLYQSDVSRQQYIQLVTSGNLYDHLLKVIKKEKKEGDGNSLKRYGRNDAKKMVMKALYCNERYPFNQLCNSYNMIFKRTFPSMGKLFSIVKFCDYKCLPILLQRIESHVVLELICKRISRERPDLPLFTIHDSIITYEENVNYVRDVMSEELRKYIGYPANLKTEFWDVQKNFEANNLSRVPVNYQ